MGSNLEIKEIQPKEEIRSSLQKETVEEHLAEGVKERFVRRYAF
jgi:hypothetical protein